MLSMAIPDNGQ